MRKITFLFWLLLPGASAFTQQVTKTAAASTQLNNVPAGVNWSTQSPTNVPPASYYQQLQQLDGKILQLRIPTGTRSNTVVLSSFGFALPANSMVGSIVATIYGRSQAEDSVVIYLTKRTVTASVTTLDTLNKKGGLTTGFAVTNTFTSLNIGEGTSQLSYWGTNLTASDVNDAGFGLAFRIKNIGSITNTTEIDSVSLTVTYSLPIVAPVKFTRFSAVSSPHGAELVWNVAMEENVDYYEVEKSAAGRPFYAIAKVNAAKNSEYRHIDPTPSSPLCFYRVRGVDFNGKVKISTVVTWKKDATTNAIKVFPLPAQNYLTVQHQNAGAGSKIWISTEDGRTVMRFIPVMQSTTSRINMGDLDSGIYFLHYENEGKIETIKIIKL